MKAWDLTASPRNAFIKDVLVVSGGISAGAFSRDLSHLLIGDATGKVHVLAVDDSDLDEGQESALVPPIQNRDLLRPGGLLPANIRRPKVLIPHPEPPPPKGRIEEGADDRTGRELADAYLKEGQIAIVNDVTIGAVQGVNYHETGLYCIEAHQSLDGTQPLLPFWQATQQSETQRKTAPALVPALPAVRCSDTRQHKQNLDLDLRVETLPPSTVQELRQDRVELRWDVKYKFDFENSPGKHFELFRESEGARRERKDWERSQRS